MHTGTEQRILERHRAFLGRKTTDRPLVGSWLYGFYNNQLYRNLTAVLKPGPVQPDDLSVDLFLQDVDWLWESYNQLDDDYPYAAGAFNGVPWMEAIMGCPIHFTGDTMWAAPCIPDWDSYQWQRPTPANPWFRKLLELLGAAVQHSNGRYGCTPTLMRGVADICAAMRGGTTMALDTYDYPDKLRRLAELCAEVWVDVARAQLELIPDSDSGYILGCAGLRCWMPEKGVWLQDDAAALLSPESYKRFFLPYTEKIIQHFPRVAFHLHGNYLWLIDLLLPIEGIDVLELNYDPGIVQLEKIIPAWKKIQERKPCLAWMDVPIDQMSQVVAGLPANGLSVQTLATTIEEGITRRDRILGMAESPR